MTLPSLFLSHGAPTLPITDTPARAFLQQLGHTLVRPKAILVISAHWETALPTVSAVDSNETIHDFGDSPARSMICAIRRQARRHWQSASRSNSAPVGSTATSINDAAWITAPGCRCC